MRPLLREVFRALGAVGLHQVLDHRRDIFIGNGAPKGFFIFFTVASHQARVEDWRLHGNVMRGVAAGAVPLNELITRQLVDHIGGCLARQRMVRC